MKYKKFIFIIGLHRSGTSFLHDIFRTQNLITGVKFYDTFWKNEGQHLQNLLPRDQQLGGMGKFAFNQSSHLTEESEITKYVTGEKIFNQWKEHWQNPNADIFVEKSPPNITRTRLLQYLFPNSYFVVIMRHPIMQSLSNKRFIKKTNELSIEIYIKHWFKAHEILFEDLKHINNKIVFTYEELLSNMQNVINEIETFLEIEFNNKNFFINNGNKKYYNDLQKYITYENMCNEYGYSVINYTDFLTISEIKQKLINNF